MQGEQWRTDFLYRFHERKTWNKWEKKGIVLGLDLARYVPLAVMVMKRLFAAVELSLQQGPFWKAEIIPYDTALFMYVT